MTHPAEQPHVAPYHLIVEGAALVDIDGHDSVSLQAGDMLVLPRGHAHRLYTPDANDETPIYTVYRETSLSQIANEGSGSFTDILCGQFHFDARGSGTLIDALPDVVLVRTAGRQEFIGLQVLVNLLRDETNEPRPGDSAVVSHLASAFFLLLLRAWLEQAHSVPGLFALLADARLSQAFHGMLAEPERAWSLEQLAQRCSMSRASFVRMFPTVAGTTPGDLLMQLRMAQAAQALRGTSLSIGQISESVGYQSESAFNRAFKRYSGVGPGAYRRGLSQQ
jgi:AraC family transcriptional activator of mtrCDE